MIVEYYTEVTAIFRLSNNREKHCFTSDRMIFNMDNQQDYSYLAYNIVSKTEPGTISTTDTELCDHEVLAAFLKFIGSDIVITKYMILSDIIVECEVLGAIQRLEIIDNKALGREETNKKLLEMADLITSSINTQNKLSEISSSIDSRLNNRKEDEVSLTSKTSSEPPRKTSKLQERIQKMRKDLGLGSGS